MKALRFTGHQLCPPTDAETTGCGLKDAAPSVSGWSAHQARLPLPSCLLRVRAMASATVALAAGAALLPSIAQAGECRAVRGVLEETQLTGSACSSPVGLCTVAQMSGQLKGQARFVASAIVPTVDTAATGVVFVLGDTSVVDARIGNRRGTLTIKNAAAFRTVGEGDLSDTQVVVGGTGDFTGSYGALRISGTFAAGAGTADYEGSVCLH